MADLFSKLRDSSSGDQWDWKVVRTPDQSSGVAPHVYAVVPNESVADQLVSILNSAAGE